MLGVTEPPCVKQEYSVRRSDGQIQGFMGEMGGSDRQAPQRGDLMNSHGGFFFLGNKSQETRQFCGRKTDRKSMTPGLDEFPKV